MSDVEKYGLFAVVFVGVLLLLIASQDFIGDSQGAASENEGPALQSVMVPAKTVPGPVVITAPARKKPRQVPVLPVVKRVAPLPGLEAPFDPEEEPIAYPGKNAVTPAVEQGSSKSIKGSPGEYVVQSGDTLSEIANKTLGAGHLWTVLSDLNPGLDPKRLQIGQVIRLGPLADVESTSLPYKIVGGGPPADSGRKYVVQEGDSLSQIAERLMGSASATQALFAANRDVLEDMDALQVGQVLRIP